MTENKPTPAHDLLAPQLRARVAELERDLVSLAAECSEFESRSLELEYGDQGTIQLKYQRDALRAELDDLPAAKLRKRGEELERELDAIKKQYSTLWIDAAVISKEWGDARAEVERLQITLATAIVDDPSRYVWAGSNPFTGKQVLDLLNENAALRSQLAAKADAVLGETLIAWAANPTKALFVSDDGIWHCGFCTADETYNNDSDYDGENEAHKVEFVHDPDCLHVISKKAIANRNWQVGGEVSDTEQIRKDGLYFCDAAETLVGQRDQALAALQNRDAANHFNLDGYAGAMAELVELKENIEDRRLDAKAEER